MEDLINSDILYTYDDIVFHKHAIKNYSNKNGVATIEVTTSLEYYYSKSANGKIIEKRSKRGKIFYGCNNYPKCKTAFWDEPIGKKCPNCNNMLVKKGKKIKCSSCDYKED